MKSTWISSGGSSYHSGLVPIKEQILIAGDALNEGLWLFNYGSLSIKDLYETITAAMKMDFI